MNTPGYDHAHGLDCDCRFPTRDADDGWISPAHKDRSDLRNLRRLVAQLLKDTRLMGDGGYVVQFGPVTYGHMERLAQIDGEVS